LQANRRFVTQHHSCTNIFHPALHEACSNVAEHACGLDSSQSFDLWWVPDGAHGNGNGVSGAFLLRDRGRAFRFEEWTPPDPSRGEVRKRGRCSGP